MSNLSSSTLVIDPHFFRSFEYQFNRPDVWKGKKTTIYGTWYVAIIPCNDCAVRWSCALEADGPTFVPCEGHR